MITIKLWGGLGNQLFQYAYGYQLAKRVGTGIVLDTSWFSHQNLRSPDILQFNIKYDHVEQTWNSDKRIGLINTRIINHSLSLLRLSQFPIGKFHYLKETRAKYLKEFSSYSLDDSYVDGYWQCPLYFDQVRDDLVELFTLNHLSDGVHALGEELKSRESVAIHVRRGDYPKKKQLFGRLVTIGEEYYKKAVESVFDKVDHPIFYVFSDDMDDAMNMLDPFISGHTERIGVKTTYFDEWYLMKCCRHQVIGNSTFSWWPAYLNENKGKIVVAPGKYNPNDNMACDDWMQIDF